MIARLDPRRPAAFPDIQHALREPNGLIAVGGDLSVTRLWHAYRRGIFPWFNAGDPILWWSPDPRMALEPQGLRLSRSLRKRLRRRELGVTLDQAFPAVIEACAAPRAGAEGTWIVPEMIAAYIAFHRAGFAHSVEVWSAGRLVGGLYGVAIGRVFFGESMFSRADDASKVALVALCQQLSQWEFALIDCQMRTDHLQRLGAVELSRSRFLRVLDHACAQPQVPHAHWRRPDLAYPDPDVQPMAAPR